MIKPIMKSEFFLRLPSEDAGPDDAATGQDLLDTLHEHERECVGLAANMIGVAKRIIAVEAEDGYLVLFNPVILKKSGPYNTEDVSRFPASAPVLAIAALRLSIWTRISSTASKTSRATPPRSSNTKSTTVAESLFSSADSRKLPAAKQLQGAFHSAELLSH